MKKYLFVAVVFFIGIKWKSSIYDIKIKSVEGQTIDLSSYQKKRIIVNVFDGLKPDTAQLLFLDSLQKVGGDELVVIAIPASDYSKVPTSQDLISVRDNLELSLIITESGKVKKEASGQQLALVNWLTNVEENTHFEIDVDEPGRIFIINSEGILYSILTAETPHNIVNQILEYKVVE